MITGEDIKARRLSLGLSQQKLADEVGCHLTQIQRLEWGKMLPENLTVNTAIKLARVLGLDIRQFEKNGEDD